MADPELGSAIGFVEASVRTEFPGLRLAWLTVSGRPRRTSPGVERRLRALSNRYRGGSVVAMRTQPIPHAYRAFFRQIGLDPDVTRVPSEEAAVARLVHGRFVSRDAISDALLVALVETGVPVWALDADRIDPGGLGIRLTIGGEGLGSGGVAAAGRLAVADRTRLHALLFGEVVPESRVEARTTRLGLFAVGVAGVPAVHLEEALWIAAEALGRA